MKTSNFESEEWIPCVAAVNGFTVLGTKVAYLFSLTSCGE
jgi:hypothetical protein